MKDLRIWAVALLALNLAACINDGEDTYIEAPSSSSALSSGAALSSANLSYSEMSSSSRQASSSGAELPSSSSSAVVASSAAQLSSSSAPRSVLHGGLHTQAFLYSWDNMQFLSLYLGDTSLTRTYDSLSLRLYFTAPVGFDVNTLGFTLDIGMRYDAAGFNSALDCSSELMKSVRKAIPQSLGTLAPNGELEYVWELPLAKLHIGVLESVRLDLRLTKMLVSGSLRDYMTSAPDFTLGSGDYSFETLTTQEKDYGYSHPIPAAPRLLVYSGSELVWGTEP